MIDPILLRTQANAKIYAAARYLRELSPEELEALARHFHVHPPTDRDVGATVAKMFVAAYRSLRKLTPKPTTPTLVAGRALTIGLADAMGNELTAPSYVRQTPNVHGYYEFEAHEDWPRVHYTIAFLDDVESVRTYDWRGVSIMRGDLYAAQFKVEPT